MYIWWKDSEVKRIGGIEFMAIYEFGRPKYMKNVPGYRAKVVDYWIDVLSDVVLDAMEEELQSVWQLQEHYEM